MIGDVRRWCHEYTTRESAFQSHHIWMKQKKRPIQTYWRWIQFPCSICANSEEIRYRWLSADTHVRYLCEMHIFLTKGMNFNCVPNNTQTGTLEEWLGKHYYKQVLLQNISTRPQLYYLSNSLTCNARSVSTLSNESFFADLVRYDKESHR